MLSELTQLPKRVFPLCNAGSNNLAKNVCSPFCLQNYVFWVSRKFSLVFKTAGFCVVAKSGTHKRPTQCTISSGGSQRDRKAVRGPRVPIRIEKNIKKPV